MTIRWLVTGAGGMLGRDLGERLAGDALTALTRQQLDVTDYSAVADAVRGHDVVINAAGWTDVDAAEAFPEKATRVNGIAALAEVCRESGAHLIQISTDYVFSGDTGVPYAEDSPTNPVNAYGRGKLVAESALEGFGYVVRTAWLYGRHGRNFIRTMLGLAQSRDTLDVVADQTGQPTWTHALASQVVELGRAAVSGNAPPGIYHGTASSQTTWYELARAAYSAAGLDPQRIRPVTSDAFPRPARRPTFSVLRHDRWAAAGLKPQPAWEIQLADAFAAGTFDDVIRRP